jgi:hypothetical protein
MRRDRTARPAAAAAAVGALLMMLTFGTAVMTPTAARAEVILYDTTTSPLHDNSGFPAAPELDDCTFAGPGPISITAMDFAYWYRVDPFDPPANPLPEDVDALVTFWDNMNTSATGSAVVNSGSLGSFRRHIGVIAPNATGTAGLFTLPSAINVPDTTVGVQINFVLTNTTTISDVVTRIATNLPTVGSTVDKYWNDDLSPGGSFQGQDNVKPNPGTPGIHENMAIRLDGTGPSSTPEPSSAVVLLTGAAVLAVRRGRRHAKLDMHRGTR